MAKHLRRSISLHIVYDLGITILDRSNTPLPIGRFSLLNNPASIHHPEPASFYSSAVIASPLVSPAAVVVVADVTVWPMVT
jgi:hypothetical protein